VKYCILVDFQTTFNSKNLDESAVVRLLNESSKAEKHERTDLKDLTNVVLFYDDVKKRDKYLQNILDTIRFCEIDHVIFQVETADFNKRRFSNNKEISTKIVPK